VIEADEYDYMFWGLTPDIAVVTNVEHDHPDIFPTADDFRAAFEGFVKRLHPGGKLVLCGEDPGALALREKIDPGQQTTLIYGFKESGWDYSASDLVSNSRSGMDFMVTAPGEGDQNHPVSLQVPGEHNVLNALGAFAAADQIGLDRERVSRALSDFQGSERRFEVRGEFQGVLVVDDYAHHPTEILMTLKAARSAYPERRVWAVWQPHTYSRTAALSDQFTAAFKDADRVIVLDVYPARESKPEGFEIRKLVDAINHPEVEYVAKIDQAVDYLLEKLAPADLLLVFTAGDAIQINDRIEEYLKSGAGINKGEES
jgi:UDP-N-acetylmuramate--alanine ligase